MNPDYDKERVVASAEQLLAAIRAVVGGDSYTMDEITYRVREVVFWATGRVMGDEEDGK